MFQRNMLSFLIVREFFFVRPKSAERKARSDWVRDVDPPQRAGKAEVQPQAATEARARSSASSASPLATERKASPICTLPAPKRRSNRLRTAGT